MNDRKVMKSYKHALTLGRALCSFCNRPLTASDEVAVIGKRSKAVIHRDCAILECEP